MLVVYSGIVKTHQLNICSVPLEIITRRLFGNHHKMAIRKLSQEGYSFCIMKWLSIWKYEPIIKILLFQSWLSRFLFLIIWIFIGELFLCTETEQRLTFYLYDWYLCHYSKSTSHLFITRPILLTVMFRSKFQLAVFKKLPLSPSTHYDINIPELPQNRVATDRKFLIIFFAVVVILVSKVLHNSL